MEDSQLTCENNRGIIDIPGATVVSVLSFEVFLPAFEVLATVSFCFGTFFFFTPNTISSPGAISPYGSALPSLEGVLDVSFASLSVFFVIVQDKRNIVIQLNHRICLLPDRSIVFPLLSRRSHIKHGGTLNDPYEI